MNFHSNIKMIYQAFLSFLIHTMRTTQLSLPQFSSWLILLLFFSLRCYVTNMFVGLTVTTSLLVLDIVLVQVAITVLRRLR